MMRLVKWVLSLLKWLIIAFFTSTILAVIAYRFIPVYVTPLMVVRCVEQIEKGEKLKWYHKWVPLDKMSKHLPVAVMAGEDAKFLKHNGFDYEQIKVASKYNKTHKRKRGASTITQQTAKNVFLWQGKTYIRKGLEAYFTVLIELFWSKHRIMEVYLNSIEMGDGIYGAESVARHHFGKTAQTLTRSECALIAASLPNPFVFSSKSPSKTTLRKQHRIEKEMKYIPSFPKEGEKYDPKTSSGGIYRQ